MMNTKKTRGKILKVRLGYNANSSSIAAVVTFFLWGAAAAVLIINMIAAVLTVRKADKTKPEAPIIKAAPDNEA